MEFTKHDYKIYIADDQFPWIVIVQFWLRLQGSRIISILLYDLEVHTYDIDR